MFAQRDHCCSLTRPLALPLQERLPCPGLTDGPVVVRYPASMAGMRGLMQESPLVVTTILDHAARFHGEQASRGRLCCLLSGAHELCAPDKQRVLEGIASKWQGKCAVCLRCSVLWSCLLFSMHFFGAA